jgi:hypothetical protein
MRMKFFEVDAHLTLPTLKIPFKRGDYPIQVTDFFTPNIIKKGGFLIEFWNRTKGPQLTIRTDYLYCVFGLELDFIGRG